MTLAQSAEPVELSRVSFDRLARFITHELGITMPDAKLTMVQSRLLRRVRELQLASIDQYTEYLLGPSHAQEREHFINAITTNKTDFFREPDHFTYLRAVVLPALTRVRSGVRLKAWSAGCSSGEEAYTLAMVLAEYAACQPGFDFAILATDVSTKVLERARVAIYSQSQITPIPPELRAKYLLASRDRHERLARVTPDLRRKVSFHQLNFMDKHYPIKDTFEIIFFRNVMIYFDRDTREAVLNKICRHLAPGGYLFGGHSESLTGLDLPLQPVKPAIYRKVTR